MSLTYQPPIILPPEILLDIFEFLIARPRGIHSPWDPPKSVLTELLNPALVSHQWCQCAQLILFRNIELDTHTHWIPFVETTNAKTSRGAQLGGLVQGLWITIMHVHERFVRSEWNHTAYLDLLIENCPNLKLLSINRALPLRTDWHLARQLFGSVVLPSSLECLSITESVRLSLPAMSPITHEDAISAVESALLESLPPTLRSLRLQNRTSRYPNALERNCIPTPSAQLGTCDIPAFCPIMRAILTNSTETLEHLVLMSGDNLPEVAVTFPNLISLQVHTVPSSKCSTSLATLTSLQSFHWTDPNPFGIPPFVQHLPLSLRSLRFRGRTMVNHFKSLVVSGKYPALGEVLYGAVDLNTNAMLELDVRKWTEKMTQNVWYDVL